jgi:hypothetical protein
VPNWRSTLVKAHKTKMKNEIFNKATQMIMPVVFTEVPLTMGLPMDMVSVLGPLEGSILARDLWC